MSFWKKLFGGEEPAKSQLKAKAPKRSQKPVTKATSKRKKTQTPSIEVEIRPPEKRIIMVASDDSPARKEILDKYKYGTKQEDEHLVVIGRDAKQTDIREAERRFIEDPQALIVIDPWATTSQGFQHSGTILIVPGPKATTDEIQQIGERWGHAARIRGGVGTYAMDIQMILDRK